jgi:hypothetical protein
MRRTFWWTQEPSDADRTRGASGDVYWVGFGEPLMEPYSVVSGLWRGKGHLCTHSDAVATAVVI